MIDFYAAQVIFLLKRMFLSLLCSKEGLTSLQSSQNSLGIYQIKVCLSADPKCLSNPLKKNQTEIMFLTH